jgi:hypothetical protein
MMDGQIVATAESTTTTTTTTTTPSTTTDQGVVVTEHYYETDDEFLHVLYHYVDIPLQNDNICPIQISWLIRIYGPVCERMYI